MEEQSPSHDLDKIKEASEARPSKMSSWTYVFFIDFDGHRESEAIRNVLTEVENVASELKTLGSYPKADD